MIKRALLATDGSQHSQQALEYALEFLPGDTKLTIISVIPQVTKKELEKSLSSYHERVLKDAENEVKRRRPDIIVRIILEEGLPAEAICHHANQENVDIIIMGSRGIGGVKGWILGSVSRTVVNTCTKPIFIIK